MEGQPRNKDLFAQLGAEHALIHAVLEALDVFVQSIGEDSSENLHEVIRFVTFVRGYADGLHHEREEVVLLPTLALAGYALDSGPLAYIRDQHREEAQLLLELEKSASAPAPWDAAAITRIAAAASSLGSFERRHMAKEREVLFQTAEKDLVPHADALARAMARFERSREPRWDPRWLEGLGHELVAQHPKR
jgi:hemerythrin-like domain-containing protein